MEDKLKPYQSIWITSLTAMLLVCSGCTMTAPWKQSVIVDQPVANNDPTTSHHLPVADQPAMASAGPSKIEPQALASGAPYMIETATPPRQMPLTQTIRAQSPDDSEVVYADGSSAQTGSSVQPATYQYPELYNHPQGGPAFGLNSPNVGNPNEQNPLAGAGSVTLPNTFPQNYADLDIIVAETQTGRVNFGGAYNSDNGLVGQFTVDERNFDIRAFPRSFRELFNGTAFRGGGQTFRLELVPGSNLERYLVSFSEPYFRGTNYSFSASGYLFQRQYFDWDEERLGGRFSLGRRLTPDLSLSAGVRLESVTIDNPRVGTSPQLNANLGNSNLFLGNVGLIRDTRDHAFLTTAGSYLALTYTQAFGDFSYSRGDIDYRRYRLIYERPDGSGRHTISFGTKLGFSGSSTPVFENYFAGGFFNHAWF